jgi:hypothetical protein
MGWQSYRHVVTAGSADEAFEAAKDQVDWLTVPDDGPTGTVLEQNGFQVVELPAVDDLTPQERDRLPLGTAYARAQAFETRLAAQDRGRWPPRTNYRSWIADLGDGTMIVFGWAHAG